MKRRYFEWAVTALLPLAFIGAGWLNVMAFVLDGHRHELFRRMFVLGIQALSLLIFLLKVGFMYRKEPSFRRPIRYAVLIPAVFAALYLWAMLVSANKGMVLKEAIVEGGYLASAWCAILIIALEKRLPSFLKTCRVYAVILAPVMVYYCVRLYLPGADWNDIDLGVLSYMPLAYMLLSFCLFFLAGRILDRDTPENPRLFWVDFALFLLFSITITLSGTKGAIICLLFGGGIFLLYPLFSGRSWRGFSLYTVSSVMAVLLFSTVCFPAELGPSRIQNFLTDLSASQTVDTSGEIEAEDSVLARLGIANEPSAVIRFVQTGDAKRAFDKGLITREEYKWFQDTAYAMDDTIASRAHVDWTDADLQLLEDLIIRQDLLTDGVMDYAAVVSYVNCGDAWQASEEGTLTDSEFEFLWVAAYKLNRTSTGGRGMLWRNAVRQIKSSPLTGHGPMSYHTKYGTYPHNLFLEIGADFGIPVLLLVLCFGLWVFLRLIRRSFASPEIAAATLYILAELTSHMLSGSLYSNTVFYQCGFCVLLFFYLGDSKKNSSSRTLNKEST